MKYIVISKNCNPWSSFRIHAEVGGYAYPHQNFQGYSEREAVTVYRRMYGLIGKHLERIYV